MITSYRRLSHHFSQTDDDRKKNNTKELCENDKDDKTYKFNFVSSITGSSAHKS